MTDTEEPLRSPILRWLADYMDKCDANPSFINVLGSWWVLGLVLPIGALHEMYLRGEFGNKKGG